jgi:hypothetical protein
MQKNIHTPSPRSGHSFLPSGVTVADIIQVPSPGLSGVGFLGKQPSKEGKRGQRKEERNPFLIRYQEEKPAVSEERDVSSESIIAMGTAGVNASAALESSASPCLSVMELWDGASQVVWDHECSGAVG